MVHDQVSPIAIIVGTNKEMNEMATTTHVPPPPESPKHIGLIKSLSHTHSVGQTL